MAMQRIILALLCMLFVQVTHAAPQEKSVNQRKIEREREKKRNAAQKDYEAGVRRHKKMQSKQTKSSMKKSRKEAPAKTPIRH